MTRLEQVRAELQEISKNAGEHGIDKNIFDLVVALNYCGFRTIGCCEGHYRPQERMYPWVNVIATNTKFPVIRGVPSSVKRQWKKESARLKQLLEFFSTEIKDNCGCSDERFELVHDNDHFAMLAPVSASILDRTPRELISRKQATLMLTRYHALVKRLAEFLIRHHDEK